MIEINLLPPQYRSVERTPLPVFLSLIGGLALIGAAFVGLLLMMKAVQRAEEAKSQITAERDKKKKLAEEVDQLERDIAEAKGRVDTVLGIADSKIFWGIKLDQLMRILPEGVIWIDSLSIVQRPTGGELRLECNAKGVDLQRFTGWKQTLRQDTNFFYHFDGISAPVINVVKAGKEYAADLEYLQFSMSLPIRQVELSGPRK